jgi:transcriptional regulator with XRE-family HTH domain
MFSSRLNKIRKSKNITAQHMADTLCINIRSYRAYESADRMPNLEMLVKIADILDVSTDYLLCRDDFLKSHAISFDEYQ